MRRLAFHAHFYQPPRENPWAEWVERQPSAAPHHDWNARISHECYERIGAKDLFARLSFDIGPTLASWLERERPEVLAAARRGERGALMLPYGHPIMPLAEAREKKLQLAWGRADFRRRFGRDPIGLWLPECAVDLPTLEAAAEFGLRYTVVAPEQLETEPPPGAGPLRVALPSGGSFLLFVFDGPASRALAFGDMLSSKERLVEELRAALERTPDGGLLLLAADGETFGHHKPGAEEILAGGLDEIARAGLAEIVPLDDAVRDLPAEQEARLREPSSWSCPHGVGRWERDCGCGTEEGGGAWRAPLRRAVSALRDRTFRFMDGGASGLMADPWAAAADYGELLVQPPSAERARRFAGRAALVALEALRHTLLAATSCGWFFESLERIETRQVLAHAARAAELLRRLTGEEEVEAPLTPYLERVRPLERTAEDAIAWHAALRALDALAGPARPPAAGQAVRGAFELREPAPPRLERHAAGGLRFTGSAEATHLRTLDRRNERFEIEVAAPGEAARLALGGRPYERGGPARDALEELALVSRDG